MKSASVSDDQPKKFRLTDQTLAKGPTNKRDTLPTSEMLPPPFAAIDQLVIVSAVMVCQTNC